MRYFQYAILFTFFSCKSVNNYYHGRVLDETNKPIENVVVTEDTFEKKTRTNKMGYFKLSRNPDGLGNLLFFKEGYKADTIPSVWSQHGEIILYNFIEKDTTIVRMKPLK